VALPDPRLSLRLLDVEQTLFCSQFIRLTPADLALPSNLDGWNIAELPVHVTRVCDSLLLAVQRAIVGHTTPVFGPTTQGREDEIRAMDVAGLVELQRVACRQLAETVDGLSDSDLTHLMFPFGQGPRNISWFCSQLLTEVAFHRWDLERSLGAEHPLDDGLASHLLTFLLNPEWPSFGRRRSTGGQQAFSVTTGDEAWTLTTTSNGTTIAPGTASDAPVISAEPGWLALAVYGRVRVDDPAFQVHGSADTADRFASVFGPSSSFRSSVRP
jgi:uncharacterized protein (TIGR03083 family)